MQERFGTHLVTFDPPDLVLAEPRGSISGPEASAMIERLVEWSHGRPYMLLLIDLRWATTFAPEARRVLTSNGHRLPPRALALHGGSFSVRVIMDLMERASFLLGSKNRWTKHHPSEEAARAWLDALRPSLACAGRAGVVPH